MFINICLYSNHFHQWTDNSSVTFALYDLKIMKDAFLNSKSVYKLSVQYMIFNGLVLLSKRTSLHLGITWDNVCAT